MKKFLSIVRSLGPEGKPLHVKWHEDSKQADDELADWIKANPNRPMCQFIIAESHFVIED